MEHAEDLNQSEQEVPDILSFEGRKKLKSPEMVHISNLPAPDSSTDRAIKAALGMEVVYSTSTSSVICPWPALARGFEQARGRYREALATSSSLQSSGSAEEKSLAFQREVAASSAMVDAKHSAIVATQILLDHLAQQEIVGYESEDEEQF